MDDFYIDDSEHGYGPVFVPRSPWRPEFGDLLGERGIKLVRLSASAGWRGPELDFLRELSFLEGVEVYSWDVRDIRPLASLVRLRLLALDCDVRRAFDLTTLPQLEIVKATWKRPIESLAGCRGLRELNVSNWRHEGLEPIAAGPGLVKLLLTSKKLRTLRGLSSLTALEWLDLHACPKLACVAEVGQAQRLRRLEISSSRSVEDLASIGQLVDLRWLALDDCGPVDSLAFLRACRNLETLSFLGTTRVVDGDLSFIADLLKLRTLRFAPRRHYSHRRHELLRTPEGHQLSAPDPGKVD